MEDVRAEIPLNITVQGDVVIVIYHARSTLGGRLQAKVRQWPIFVYILPVQDLKYEQMQIKWSYWSVGLINGMIMI